MLICAPGAETPPPTLGGNAAHLAVLLALHLVALILRAKLERTRFSPPKLGAGAIAWGQSTKVGGRRYRLGAKYKSWGQALSPGGAVQKLGRRGVPGAHTSKPPAQRFLIPQSWGRRGAPGAWSRKPPDSQGIKDLAQRPWDRGKVPTLRSASLCIPPTYPFASAFFRVFRVFRGSHSPYLIFAVLISPYFAVLPTALR